PHAIDVGGSTPFLWVFEQRDKLLEFCERVSWFRMHISFIQPSGVAQDLSHGLCRDIDFSTQQFASRIDKIRIDVDRQPPIWKQRLADMRLEAEIPGYSCPPL
ncbi:unnamed protein product, partial [Linum tenue]